jgi:P-type conjugative transfer protein TrbG
MKIVTFIALVTVSLLSCPLAQALDERPAEPKLPSSPAIDLASVAATLDETNEELLDQAIAPEVVQALDDAKVEYAQTVRERAETASALKQQEPEGPSQTLEALATEVDELKSKVVVEKASILALQSPRRVKVTGAKTVFNYLDTSVYEVTSAVDHVTDIQLKPGESLTTPPTSGDTVRWSIGIMKSGSAPEETTHLIVKPLDDNIQTNLIIATDQHVYQLRLKSGSYHMPVVAWNYPEDSARAFQAAVKKEASNETTINPDDLRFSYEIASKGSYPWKPVRVFDDGKKTFIQMPKDMRVSEAPVLFLLEDGSEPLLTNYRVKGDYYIVDRLIEKAELRVGPSKKVTIELERPNWFERNFL